MVKSPNAAATVEPGRLYIVATPIGNLADVTFRAQSVLAAVDVILCEDTRVTGILCHALGIDRPKEAFHEHNAAKRVPGLIRRLEAGETFALVSDRGMPTVSDPGRELVAACHQSKIPISVIPGPSALTTAFAGSGYPHPWVFWGFLPSHGRQRHEALERVEETAMTQILYEAPHRLGLTLADLSERLGPSRQLTIARELTKPYEEFWQGTLETARAQEDDRFRGELVLVIAPGLNHRKPRRTEPESPQLWLALEALVYEHVGQGDSESEAIRRVASQFRLPRRALYEKVHRERRDPSK